MKKFNIKEDDVINIDKYINERPKIKKEISELSKNQDNLKNEIEINRNNYETLVDKTTLELENFIKRNDPDSKIQ